MLSFKRSTSLLAAVLCVSLFSGCALVQRMQTDNPDRATNRDKTKKGAGIGAAAGAVLGAVLGEGEADEILAGAAIGAGIGAGIGAYMDRQEEKIAQIPGTSVERVDEDTLFVHFDSDLLFDVDSAVLTPRAQGTLDEASNVLVEYDKTAVVAQGHTDSSGSEQHNQALSERRAMAVANYLVGRGVNDQRVVHLGYGEGSPVANNDTVAGRERNRRVDLLLKAKRK